MAERSAFPAVAAALVGAIVGGVITYQAMVRVTETQALAHAYNLYIFEAVSAMSIRHEDHTLTAEQRARLGGALGVLSLHASEDVICWATKLLQSLVDKKPTEMEFHQLTLAMREDMTGQSYVQAEKCQLFPRDM